MSILSAGGAVLSTAGAPASAIRRRAPEDLPIRGIGVNLPRNEGQQGYNYQPTELPDAALDEIARHARWVRCWTAYLSDLCGVANDVTAGPSGKLTWTPHAGATKLALSIEKAARRGLTWWLPIFDGLTSYRPVTTWNTRGRNEVMDFVSAFAAWWAERFGPQDLVFAPVNENPDSEATSPSHSSMIADASDAIRAGAPHHWAALGTRYFCSMDGVFSLAPPADVSRRFIDLHNYDIVYSGWRAIVPQRIQTGQELGMPVVFGEYDASFSYDSNGMIPFPDPDGATRRAAYEDGISTILNGGATAVGLWNTRTGGGRTFTFTPPTPSVPRAITWLPNMADMVRAFNVAG